MDAIGDFFSQFQANDWATAALAVVAILISVGTLLQNAWFRPKPHFEIEWEPLSMVGPNGVLITICRIWNDGDATARNVRLSVEAEGVVCNLKYWEHWHEYEPGKGKHGFEVPLEPVDYGWTSLSTKEMYPTAWTDEQRRYPNHEMQGVFTREKVLRPIVKIRYRGRWRPVSSKAPALSGTPTMGGC
ncbi:hypothetical protein [Microbacterium hominis]|uniref:Uncharacterized protein n=1 Tax=Microbacterium hominis TaxID=162426 RepID=A0A7D4QHP4_9MICO|nr:hypothetical protein [Microbacterium hominis]QKJ18956.1 hypothetical protein HQM25_05885 [Microbacterium hominis]